MSFNTAKFKILKYGKREDLKQLQMFTEGFDEIIEETEEAKSLGILFNTTATFETHVAYIANRMRYTSNMILRCFQTREAETLRTVWMSLVGSIQDYGLILFLPANSVTACNKLNQPLKAFSRKIQGMKDLEFPERLRKLELMSTGRRAEYLKICNIHREILQSVRETRYSDRRGLEAIIPQLSGSVVRFRNLQDNSYSCEAPRLFNTIPMYLRETICPILFKKGLKCLFMSIPDNPANGANNSIKNYMKEIPLWWQIPDHICTDLYKHRERAWNRHLEKQAGPLYNQNRKFPVPNVILGAEHK